MSRSPSGGRRRPVKAAALLALAVTTGLLVALGRGTPVAAMTQVDAASGRAGDTVTVRVRNDTPQGTAPWLLTAPADTRILAARVGAGGTPAGPGNGACTVEVDGSTAACPDTGPAGWQQGEEVELRIGLDADATAGSRTGTSTLGTETGSFTVEVLPAPTTPRLRHLGPRSVVAGRTVPHTVIVRDATPDTAVRVDRGRPARVLSLTDCRADGTPVDCAELTTRSVRLGDAAADGTVRLTMDLAAAASAGGTEVRLSSRASTAGSAGPPARGVASLTVTGLPPITVDAPADGATLDQRRPVLRGTGDPLAVVELRAGGRVLCRDVAVAAAGTWSCRPDRGLPYGWVHLRGWQVDAAGLRSPEVRLRVRVRRPSPTVVAAPPAPIPAAPAVAAASGQVPDRTPPVAAAPRRGTDRPPARGRDRRTPAEPVAGSAPLRFGLRAPAAPLVPGNVATYTGSIGPNGSGRAVTVTLLGRATGGLLYRSVVLDPVARCAVARTQFSCTLRLPPGESAELSVRAVAGASGTSATVTQQLRVASSDPAQANATTLTSRVGGADSETASLAAAVSTFPGPLVPLLALLLLALAATQAERRRGPRPDPRSSHD